MLSVNIAITPATLAGSDSQSFLEGILQKKSGFSTITGVAFSLKLRQAFHYTVFSVRTFVALYIAVYHTAREAGVKSM